MSDLNTRATVHLQVNGQQAEQTLQQLKSNAMQLESAIAKAAAAGNKTDLKRLRKELADTKRQIREIESSTMQVEHVMSRLDKASPRELSRTLATLNKQLDYMERGSAAWNAHIEKIRMVKAEIASVNDEVRNQEGMWTRFNRTMNDWQTTIMGAAAAVTGLIMAGKSAVNAYAEMDAELANVRKFTGMTAIQVNQLNEEFKKMDTRTSRENLNKLAEEAGRLGKTSEEDILGFVRAADKINVALDDLGEGATLTLSKLTNIFGDEKKLGTEKALLSVGSVINELSQNCTASAPYLANFAQRMAGVGAQAGLTIPQLMAFGAVLDSQGQACEMSATALSKLTMDLFKDTERVAEATGIPLKELQEALSKGTNEGLILLLEKLHDMGDMSVLAPVFKDMGENGARASQVIAALAGNIDQVKWEQEEASKAFQEATSVTNEYDVQNNTVQAGLDKAKKRLTELAVELGEKLLPIMSHVYSSSSLILRLLSSLVDFVIKYKREIIVLTSAFVTYKLAINAANIAFKLHYAWIVATQTAQKVGAAVMATYKSAVLMCSVAYNKMTGNLTRAAAAQRAMNTASKANIYALLASLVVALAVAVWQYSKRLTDTQYAEKEMNKIRLEATKKAEDERVRINLLRQAAMNEKLSLDERKKAIDKLNKVIPGYNAFLDKTTGKYHENKQALDDYIASLVRMYEIEGAKDKLKEIGRKKADLAVEKKEAQQGVAQAQKNISDQQKSMLNEDGTPKPQTSMGSVAPGSYHAQIGNSGELAGATARLRKVNEEIAKQNALEKAITDTYGAELQRAEIKAQPELPEPVTYDPNAPGGTIDLSGGGDGSGGSGGGGDGASKDKFEKEKAWKEHEEALNRIAYAKGEKDYDTYTNRMNDIETEFYAKELQHTDLSADERLKIEADYYESQKKGKDEVAKQLKELDEKQYQTLLDTEEESFNEAVALEKQRYIDGKVDLKGYEDAQHLLELEHMRTMTLITKEGSKERAQAVSNYQDALIADQKKHQEEAEKLAKEHQEALAKIKKDVFGLNPSEREAAYKSDLALLQEVYNQELIAAGDNAKEKLRIEKAFQKAKLALMEEYNIEGADMSRNFLEEWNDDIMDFLNSDLGSAITGAVDTLVSGMSSIFQQLTSIVQAELEIQQADIDKRYDAEVSLAEGNNYKISKLEKQREAEQAKAKKEANKKLFAMQVIQAVAQTAQAAINAYSSAAAVPVVGYILAPIAAAMAVTAGMLQVAAIKKQQQASEAQGYKSGGFTPEGAEDEVKGVVHAGEWVASQKLVSNPETRPILEALDYAQRTNTIGSLSAEDVSSTITAPAVMAKSASMLSSAPQKIMVDNSVDNSSSDSTMKEMAEVIGSLKQRLDEPFITVNSVTGETGMKQAQDEYDKLIRNKTPKSRR